MRVVSARSRAYSGKGSLLDLAGSCLGGLCPALQSGVRRGWRVRTLPFQYVMQQHGSSPLFFSDGSDGLTSSFFGGVASAKGLSSVILLRLLGRASFAAYVALFGVLC